LNGRNLDQGQYDQEKDHQAEGSPNDRFKKDF
jgi:hypothetical protein